MKTVTQKVIAKKANVSVMTVSRVINNEKYVDENVRKKIWSIIKKYNYSMNVMARGLRTNKVNALGIIFRSGINVFAIPYFSNLLQGFEQVCIENSYDILLGTSEYRDFQYQRLATQRKAAAYMIVAPSVEEIPGFEKVDSSNCPFLIVNSRGKFNYIDADNSQCIKDVVKILARQGRKKIGFIKGPYSSSNAQERYNSYVSALEIAGLPLNKAFVWNGEFDTLSGERAGVEIVKMEDRPDAVIAANDLTAIGLIKILNRYVIKVPDEIAVVGYDNIGNGEHLQPRLSSIDPHSMRLGAMAAKTLLQLIKDPKLKVRETIGSEIIFRDSFKVDR